MSIRRKALPQSQKEKEPLELQLLATFPRPPPGPRSPARLSLKSPGLAPRPSNYGFISTNATNKDVDVDADSLYDEPGPSTPPLPQRNVPSFPVPGPPILQPVAELQLVLDHPSKVYSPGETITGYIIGWSTTEEHIHIVLSGCSRSSFKDSKAANNDRAPLLFQVTHLEPGLQTSVPRFGISIPNVCGTAQGDLNNFTPRSETGRSYWTPVWSVQDPFENGSGHPLPPSMHMSPRSVSTLSSIKGEASISYNIIAVRSTLDPSTHGFVPNATFPLPLALTTRRLLSAKTDLLERETFTLTAALSIQTAALTKERKLRFREQLCDAFNTSTPTFYFSVNVTAPKLGTPGADLRVGIRVDVLPPPPGHLYNFPVPDVTIASITFRIRSYTGVRVLVPSPASAQSADISPGLVSKKETFKSTELHQTQTPNNATFRPQNGGFDGQVCVATVPLPRDLTPSFKTFNAWRGYRLQYTVRVQVAGKEEEVKVANDLDIVVGEDTRIERKRTGHTPVKDGMSRRIAEAVLSGDRARRTSAT
ncbi:hypothetical protein BU23DRAFT_603572 [Bimuria novae-zelandiae CBS 107.79]|uniref:Arrestin-like N-terminal domain-containing protein n=1 Tax=Bimuria novae-zelandiae CBS 107.79 TaxID=1447943 RepID=A0A6A5UP03_9PLEO|nr:hypothetical protein BU23DRAFT_603572 [Bimuria novae-zelandiae CBS 107.79]